MANEPFCPRPLAAYFSFFLPTNGAPLVSFCRLCFSFRSCDPIPRPLFSSSFAELPVLKSDYRREFSFHDFLRLSGERFRDSFGRRGRIRCVYAAYNHDFKFLRSERVRDFSVFRRSRINTNKKKKKKSLHKFTFALHKKARFFRDLI